MYVPGAFMGRNILTIASSIVSDHATALKLVLQQLVPELDLELQ